MPIGVAILGSGIFAREEHLPAILKTPSLELKAVYSRTHASAKKLVENESALQHVQLYASDHATDTLDELIARTDIAAVVIALPIIVQPEIIKRAMRAGKHILSEKPIGPDLATARELLAFHRNSSPSMTWAVAENFRFYSRFRFAAGEVQRLGRVLGFRMRMSTMVKPGGKYIETGWRKKPEYQGGFLLDGGVHFIAGIRLCLGVGARMSRLAAFATQLQNHLPPVDSVDGVVRLANGASGTISVSFGTTFTGAEWTVACERGTVDVDREKVVIVEDGQRKETPMPAEASGVGIEMAAWAKSLEENTPNSGFSPEEALADLEVLESLLVSSERGGAPVDLELQI